MADIFINKERINIHKTHMMLTLIELKNLLNWSA